MASPSAEAGAVAPVALITGGASGIGAGAAAQLSLRGYRIALIDLDEQRAQSVAAQLPGPAITIMADVTDEESVSSYMRATIDAFGRVDGFFLNAGAGSSTPLIDETVEGFDRIIRTNLRSVFLGLRAALRHRRDVGGGGAIVVTTSTAAVAGSDLASYSAAKHGAWALVRTAAIEGAAFGTRVNAVAPGSIDTPMMRSMEQMIGGGDGAARALHATTPLGAYADRYGSTREVGDVVAFLLSDDSSWVTGTTIPVDGGVLATDPYRLPDHS